MGRVYMNKPLKNEQKVYLESALENSFTDWSVLKNDILSKQGPLNEKNIDAVILKTMIRYKKLDSALSFANHLKSSTSDLSIGATNSILSLYYKMAKEKSLSDPEKQFILSTYKHLYDKYKVLDYSTSETLLHGLCAINDWKKALKVLNDLQESCTPSHSAYSTLIGTLFKNNLDKEAMNIIKKSIAEARPLQDIAYKEWINFLLRRYKNEGSVIKHLDTICSNISSNWVVIPKITAEEMKKTYYSLGWHTEFTVVRKESGECQSCKNTLQCLKLSNEEFELLQTNVKDKLIVGSDLFLKTSPKELNRFLNFLDKTAPYDIVFDALNISYAVGKGTNMEKLNLLKAVVNHFYGKNKRILLLGRKHMFGWHRQTLEYILSRTCSFFTDDISQDDPFFITAAIISGPDTDIVSKDLLRGHKFILRNQMQQNIFQKWQWQHQWKVFCAGKRPVIQPPLPFTPCAQKIRDGWHLPYEKEGTADAMKGSVNDGVPDFNSWLCLRPKDT